MTITKLRDYSDNYHNEDDGFNKFKQVLGEYLKENNHTTIVCSKDKVDFIERVVFSEPRLGNFKVVELDLVDNYFSSF